jgi:hypothetical protein
VIKTERDKALENPLLCDRPGATCLDLPQSLVDEIVAALRIPPDRLKSDRSGISIQAEQHPVRARP